MGFWRELNERTVDRWVNRSREIIWKGEAPLRLSPGGGCYHSQDSEKSDFVAQLGGRWRRAVWKGLRPRRKQLRPEPGVPQEMSGSRGARWEIPQPPLAFWSPAGASNALAKPGSTVGAYGGVQVMQVAEVSCLRREGQKRDLGLGEREMQNNHRGVSFRHWSPKLEAFLPWRMHYLPHWRCLCVLQQTNSNSGVVFFPQLAFLGEGGGRQAEERD